MLTNTLPFEAESALGVAVKHIYEEPTHPSDVKLDVNGRLAAVCLKAMQKNPKDRYQTAREMRNELRAERRSLTDVGPLGAQSPPRPRSIVDIDEATSRTPTPGSAAHLTLSGVPRPTPPSRPAAETPSPRASRIAPLAALGLVFAGVVLFKLTRPSSATMVTGTAIEGSTPAPPATTGDAPTAVADPRVPDSTARAPGSGDMPSSKASSTSSASAVGLPRIPRLTPPVEATAAVTATASASPPPPAAVSVAVPEPPPPAIVAPRPVDPPPPDPTPPAPAFDPATARVAIAGVSTTNGLTGSSVRAALGRANFTSCYQAALRAAGAPAGGSTNLHLSIDDTGHVVAATASMGFLPGARACVEGAARSIRVSNVDTGDATADVSLSFLPR
jgi:hypothetical protein